MKPSEIVLTITFLCIIVSHAIRQWLAKS